MSSMIEIVKAFFDADGMPYFETKNCLLVPINDELGKYHSFVSETNGALVCCTEFPVCASAERRTAVAEFLMRLNWLLMAGNWEVNFDDGHIRYKTAIPLRRCELTAELARNICYTNFATFSNGLSDILSVVTQDRTLEDIRADQKQKKADIQAGFEESMRKLGIDDVPPSSGSDGSN